MKRIIMLIFAVLFVLSTTPALACYTGMNLIPTVDMVDKGTLRLDLQIDGTIDKLKADTWLLNSQYGVTDKFEVGIDHDFSADASPRNFINAKFLMPASAGLKLPVALGMCGVADGSKANIYAVSAYENSFARLSFGYGTFGGNDEWFAGLDKEVCGYTLMLEYLHGDDNAWAIGAARSVTSDFSVSASLVKPNDNSDDRFTTYFTYYLPIGAKE